MSLLPLTYKTVDEINTDLPIYLKRNIGQGVFISDKQELDSKTQLWVIGNSYPAFFHIPVDSPPVVRFVTFKNISTIKIEKNENTKSFHVFVPSRKSLIEKHKEKYSSMLTSVENSLLDITKLNYVKIPLVHTAMSRIISILEDLERDTQVNPKNCPNKERDKLMK